MAGVEAGVKVGRDHLYRVAGNTVWSRMASVAPVAVRWSTINSYNL